jgi:hypothetical protein
MTFHARLLALVGLAFLLSGVALGLVPVPADGIEGCGAPFRPAGIARSDTCQDRLFLQRLPALGLAFVGGTLVAAAFAAHLTDPARPSSVAQPTRVSVLD